MGLESTDSAHSPGMSVLERVAVLESRMQHTDAELKEMKVLMGEHFKELKAAVDEIRNRKNPVMEFVLENWKVLCILGLVFLGKDVSSLVGWIRALGG